MLLKEEEGVGGGGNVLKLGSIATWIWKTYLKRSEKYSEAPFKPRLSISIVVLPTETNSREKRRS